MRTSSMLGRAGTLAVAMGVGAVAATGVAWADTDGTDSAGGRSATSSTSSDSGSDTSEKAGPTATDRNDSASEQTTSINTAGADDEASDTDDGDAAATGADKTAGDSAEADDTDTDTDTDAGAGDQESTGEATEPADDTIDEPADDGEPAVTPVPVTETRDETPDSSGADTRAKTNTKTVAAVVDTEQKPLAASTVGKDSTAISFATEPTQSVVTTARADAAASSFVAAAIAATEPEPAAPPSSPNLFQSVGMAVQNLFSGLMGALGFSPLASDGSNAPTGIAAFLALLGWGTRRQTEAQPQQPNQPVTTGQPTTPTGVVTGPVTSWVGWLTGANSINNTKVRFGIDGTDVGIIWDNGVTGDNPATTIVEQRQVLIAFGDTFSEAGMTGIWRNNVLLRSADNVLSNGIYVPNGIIHDPGAYSGSPMTNPNFAREIIGKYPYSTSPQVTIIPTGAISVPGAGVNGVARQYVSVMSIKSWDTPGNWTTNYSGVIYSDDNGQNWTVMPQSTIRSAGTGRSTVTFRPGDQNFQMVSFVKPPAGSIEATSGWVYAYGTPSGRNGTVYLSRVNEKQILDTTKYEYYDGTSWVANNPSVAKPIFQGTTTSWFFGLFKQTTYPSAGELSVQYNSYLKKYVMLSTDQYNNVVMRTSDTPQGTWSSAKTLVTSAQYPGLYAPMIHPWSGTNLLKKEDGSAENPAYLYWNMSLWGDYNVGLMKTDLSRV